MIPEEYLSSITGKIMIGPVLAADNNTYERNALLEKSLKSGDYVNCELLLRLGAEVEQMEDSTQNTLLHRTVIQGNPESVRWLLEQKAVLESRNTEGNTPLMLSVMHGRIKIAKLLLAHNANPSVTCWTTRLSALHIAAERDDVEMLKYLLKTGALALIDVQDAEGDTPLHLAVQGGHDNIIRLLLKAGASHKIRNEQGQTPIELARVQRRTKTEALIAQTVRALKKAKLEEIDRLHQVVKEQAIKIVRLETALHCRPTETAELKDSSENQERAFKMKLSDAQSQMKLLEIVIPKELAPRMLQFSSLESPRRARSRSSGTDVSNLSSKGVEGFSALAEEGEEDEAGTMLQKSPFQDSLQADDPDLKTTMDFIEAIKENNQKEFHRLLKLMLASPEKRLMDTVDARYGGSVLFWAACYGRVYFISSLIKAEADIKKLDNFGRTLVYIAAENGHADAIVALKAAGAAIDTPNNSGETPFYIAAENGHSEAIRALKTVGANVSTPMPDGATPVYIAAQNGHAGAITALKAAGANVDTPLDEDGYTPVCIAAENGHVAAITALKAAGANVNTPDKNGYTPLWIAVYIGNAAAVTALLEAGADASIQTVGITPLVQAGKCASQSKKPEHKVIVRLLEAHFKEYPNGIKPARVIGEKVVFHSRFPSSSEKKSSQNRSPNSPSRLSFASDSPLRCSVNSPSRFSPSPKSPLGNPSPVMLARFYQAAPLSPEALSTPRHLKRLSLRSMGTEN